MSSLRVLESEAVDLEHWISSNDKITNIVHENVSHIQGNSKGIGCKVCLAHYAKVSLALAFDYETVSGSGTCPKVPFRVE